MTQPAPPDDTTIRNCLRQVIDPEAGCNIVDLGLVYHINIVPPRVSIAMTMTSPACPLGDMITAEAREAIAPALPPGWSADLRLVWEPPWQQSMMTDAARKHFGWADGGDV
ncbi:MAG: metal-sulfur cluster assembly factor [Rhodocyclales bacterium]|nr:metal-sulfur cluster assembly factor [Rhodocyclales bacterium]